MRGDFEDFLDSDDFDDELADSSWEQRFVRVKQVSASSCHDVEKAVLLREALDDEHPSVRYAAVVGIRKLDAPNVDDALLFALGDSDEWVRIRAVEGLGQRNCQKAGEAFVQYLDSETHPKVRATLVKHLGSFQEERLIPIIAAYLEDQDSRVRANAVEGLGFYSTSMVAPILKPYLEDSNVRMRANVAMVLSRHGEDESARRTLEEMVYSRQDHERVGAIYSMGELRNTAHISILISLLSDPSFVIRRNVRDALVKFGLDAQGPLLKEIRSTLNQVVQVESVMILKFAGDRKAIKTLLRLREAGDGELRALAEEAMDEIILRTGKDRTE